MRIHFARLVRCCMWVVFVFSAFAQGKRHPAEFASNATARIALDKGDSAAPVPKRVPAVTSSCQPSWLPTFGGQPGTNGMVNALVVFDDGSGPALIVGGSFTAAGGQVANHIARLDSSGWTPLGSGVNGSVNALAVFDDGSGPALYAGGAFTTANGVAANNIARWDGSSWSALGSGVNNSVFALAVFDDGSGPALYAGGAFTTAGGVAASCVAKWNGSGWTALGNGLGRTGSSGPIIHALTVFADGTGSALYVGGAFSTAGGQPANNIARWNGSSWSTLGSGVVLSGSFSSLGGVLALAVFDDGTGAALVASGWFSSAGGTPVNNIARWQGASWLPLGSGMPGSVASVWALAVFDDGTGNALYAGGNFMSAGGVATGRIARWRSGSWAALGSGLTGSFSTVINALAVFDDGSGRKLYAGGDFLSAGGVPANRIARWNGSTWTTATRGANAAVYALASFEDGGASTLCAGGDFTTIETVGANRVAKWDGVRWSPMGAGVDNTIYALTVFDDGTGPALYAGGAFTVAGGAAANHVAKWDGVGWQPLSSGVNGTVHALAVFDDGGGAALYAGGIFTSAGGVSASCIARWNGATWSPLASGLTQGTQSGPAVYALAVFDDGAGSALYAGGDFSVAGGVLSYETAKWNGSIWAPTLGLAGLGPNASPVRALASFDDGSGPALYAGSFAAPVLKGKGLTRTVLGGGLGSVYGFTIFDDGDGSALYAGGWGGVEKWDGSTWTSLGSGFSGEVHALAPLEGGSGAALYVGGTFDVSPGGDSYLAKWGCAFPPGATTFGASSPGCTGPVAAGVTSSPQVGNALFAITSSNAPANAPGALLAGTALMTPFAFLNAQVWVAPVLAPGVVSNAIGSAILALPIPSAPALVGAHVDVQFLWIGPSSPSPCPPLGLSASNALALTIQP